VMALRSSPAAGRWFLMGLLFLYAGVCTAMSELPQDPMMLWSERKPVNPDREDSSNGRVFSVDNPSITPFWPDSAGKKPAAVIIFPGGGYEGLAMEHEGYDIARWFNALGVAAFVVKYRLNEYGFPAPLLDGLRAVRLVRSQAEEWGLDANRIGVIGFSAGGHLAGSVTTRSEFREIGETDPLASISAKPDFLVLAYPVITLDGTDAHAGSRRALFGDDPTPALLTENSLQYQVRVDIPPVFVMHGIGDTAVPVSNSLQFFEAVQRYNKASELHIYQTAIHGFGMHDDAGSASYWPEALAAWLSANGFAGQEEESVAAGSDDSEEPGVSEEQDAVEE